MMENQKRKSSFKYGVAEIGEDIDNALGLISQGLVDKARVVLENALMCASVTKQGESLQLKNIKRRVRSDGFRGFE